MTGNGASGGTGATSKGWNIGDNIGALHAVGLWTCAASISGNIVPPGGTKTTAGDCTTLVDQLEADVTCNPREGLGLATLVPGTSGKRLQYILQ